MKKLLISIACTSLNLIAMQGQAIKSTIEILPQELVDVREAGSNLKSSIDAAINADLPKANLYTFFYMLEKIGNDLQNAMSIVANTLKKIKAEEECKKAQERARIHRFRIPSIRVE